MPLLRIIFKRLLNVYFALNGYKRLIFVIDSMTSIYVTKIVVSIYK